MVNAAAWLILVTSTLVTLSCKSGTSAPMNEGGAQERTPATVIRTDVPGLEHLIDVPKHVASVRWEYTRTHGNVSLVAVLRLGPAELETLLRDSPKLDVQSPVTIEPRLLGEEADVKSTHPSMQWDGVNIEPRAFVNPKKGGLVNGTATVVASGRFVYLALYEM